MSSAKSASQSTGIEGLDRILEGGYPAGRPTVIRGASGTGKTLLALAFACRTDGKEGPGVIATFDESPDALRDSIAALDLGRSKSAKQVTVIDLRPDVEQLITGGDFELGGLRARIELALRKSGASRLVFDSFDTLFLAFDNKARIYSELKRIFDWSRERGITLLATCGEQTDSLYGTGIEDYASDTVIRVAQEVDNRIMTRTLRVLKCRGRSHSTTVYPFSIGAKGLSIRPITEARMTGKVSPRRLSTGIATLDAMLGGKGVFVGSVTMFSGQSGTGKSLLAASIAEKTCASGRRVHYLTFEESPDELLRNTQSIGLDLKKQVNAKRLTVTSMRSVELGLEEHLIKIMDLVDEVDPALLVLDPISALLDMGRSEGVSDVKSIILRLVAFLKGAGVTTVMTDLIPDTAAGVSRMDISSLIDTWVRLRLVESDGILSRLIHVGKSRGLPGSAEVKEFLITNDGLTIEQPYSGPSGLVFGAEKNAVRARDRREYNKRAREIQHLELELEHERLTDERQQTLDRQLRKQKLEELEARIVELREVQGLYPTMGHGR